MGLCFAFLGRKPEALAALDRALRDFASRGITADELEAARAEAREISAQTLQLAMEQVPGLVGLTRHNS